MHIWQYLCMKLTLSSRKVSKNSLKVIAEILQQVISYKAKGHILCLVWRRRKKTQNKPQNNPPKNPTNHHPPKNHKTKTPNQQNRKHF